MITTFKPKLLEWARMRAGLDEEALAKKVLGKKGSAEQVREWETTVENLRSILPKCWLKKTYTPFGYLFWINPQKKNCQSKISETIRSAGIHQPSPAMLDVIYECQRRQEWYREYLISEAAEPLASSVVARLELRFLTWRQLSWNALK